MDKPYLRHLFEENRDLLKKLYLGTHAQKTLLAASDNSLDVVLRILFLIANGEIELYEGHSDAIKKSKRQNKLVAFQSRPYFLMLLRSPRLNKLQALKQFIKIYPFLLHSFFNLN
jgi:hypothetical protein